MQQVLKIIEAEKEIERDELFSMVSIQLGISKKTFDEYLLALKVKGVSSDGLFIKYKKG
jgi:hypothetical protein